MRHIATSFAAPERYHCCSLGIEDSKRPAGTSKIDQQLDMVGALAYIATRCRRARTKSRSSKDNQSA